MMTSSNGHVMSAVDSPNKGQRRGALMFSLICACTNGWANNRNAGDLRRCCVHYDVIVMIPIRSLSVYLPIYRTNTYGIPSGMIFSPLVAGIELSRQGVVDSYDIVIHKHLFLWLLSVLSVHCYMKYIYTFYKTYHHNNPKVIVLQLSDGVCLIIHDYNWYLWRQNHPLQCMNSITVFWCHHFCTFKKASIKEENDIRMCNETSHSIQHALIVVFSQL